MRYDDKILIISTSKKSEYEVGVFNYLKTLNFNISIVKINTLVSYTGREDNIFYKSQRLANKYDIVIPFIDTKYERFYYTILSIFKDQGARLFVDPMLVEYAYNHGLLMKDAHNHNIDTLKTYMAISTKALSTIIDDLEFPLLIKIAGEGKNIVVRRRESLVSILDTIENIKKYIIVKEIFPNMTYEEYLYIGGRIFGLIKKNNTYEVVNADERIKSMGDKISAMTSSTMFSFSVLKDENGKPYLDDIYASLNLERFVDAYGNAISLSISRSIVADKGIKEYAYYLINLIKSKYTFYKVKKEVGSNGV